MASLTGTKFTIRCRKCWHGISLMHPADGKPDAMVECGCGAKAGTNGDLRLAADGEQKLSGDASITFSDLLGKLEFSGSLVRSAAVKTATVSPA
jgi:hypothetical protein